MHVTGRAGAGADVSCLSRQKGVNVLLRDLWTNITVTKSRDNNNGEGM